MNSYEPLTIPGMQNQQKLCILTNQKRFQELGLHMITAEIHVRLTHIYQKQPFAS